MTQMTLYVRLKHNTPKWKRWMIDQSNWYTYNIAWKQPIWVVYDMLNKKEIYPGGVTNNEASRHRDRLEDRRKQFVY